MTVEQSHILQMIILAWSLGWVVRSAAAGRAEKLDGLFIGVALIDMYLIMQWR